MATEPLEYLNGRWVEGTHDSNPEAVVSFGSAVGWLWWARGEMGQCTTLEDAQREALAALAEVSP